jgi:4-hydroxy-3-methylbut-2-enyl diphosphate reductase
MEDAVRLGAYIKGGKSPDDFYRDFKGKFSGGFEMEKDLRCVGVVNQTTMLATETQAIADYFRRLMIQTYGLDDLKNHFADTRDTLCYATNDNQDATYQLLETKADTAIVVGGYNSSNTSHIVELCERKFPTYFINSDKEILSKDDIQHFNIHQKEKVVTHGFLPTKSPMRIILTSGASCPDTLVDNVMLKLLDFFTGVRKIEEVMSNF